MLKKILWLVRRASVMPFQELFLRIQRFSRDLIIYPILKLYDYPYIKIHIQPTSNTKSIFSEIITADILDKIPAAFSDKCVAEAENLLLHKYSLFELKDHYLGQTIQWNFDYKNQTHIPLTYAPFIGFKAKKKQTDLKYVFEHNKHQDIPRLAQAYRLTNNQRYIEELTQRVESWIEECPFMFGIHWTSPSVSAYRLISWTLAFELLRDNYVFSDTFLDKWGKSVYQHVKFISANYSLHSSAGNHLISEATGVFAASLCWKKFFHGSNRSFLEAAQRNAYSILLSEIKSQIFSDGVNHEQSASYQVFAANQLFIAYWIGTLAGISFPLEYTDRLKKSGYFLSAIVNSHGIPPNFGDEDNAWAFRLTDGDSNKFTDQLGIWSVLFNKSSLTGPFKLCETAFWLFGMRAIKFNLQHDKIVSQHKRKDSFHEYFFSDGGYYIAKFNKWTEKEVFFFIDCGPLGTKSTGGHGHADALSIYLSLAGQPVFIDSGTYTYQDSDKRKFLRSTSAHNTLYFTRTNSQDKYLGPFLWGARHKAHGELLASGHFTGSVIWWSGEIHHRETAISNKKIKIIDKWIGITTPEIAFHLNPSLAESVCQVKDNHILIETDFGRCSIISHDRPIQIEKTFVSPYFYNLEQTLKFIIPMASKEGTQLTEINWEFK